MESNAKFVIFVLGIVLISIIGTEISALESDTNSTDITVSTDRLAYQTGETILIAGTVGQITNDYAVSLSVESPDGHIVSVHQTFPLSDKTFQAELFAGGKMWQNGSYNIFARYGPENIATTTFDYTITPIKIHVAPQKPVYDHTETVTVTGTILPYIQGQKISVTWLLPNGTVFGNSWSSNINSDGSFEAGVWNGIFSTIQGNYKAIVEYDNTVKPTSFEIRKTSSGSTTSDIKRQGQNLLTGFHKTNDLTDKMVGSGLYQNNFEIGTATLFLLIGPSEITYDENNDVTFYSNDYVIKNGRIFLKSENGESSTLVFIKESWSFEYDSEKTSFSAKGKVQNRQTEQVFTLLLEGTNDKLDRQPSEIYLIQGKSEGNISLDEFRTYQIVYLKQG